MRYPQKYTLNVVKGVFHGRYTQRAATERRSEMSGAQRKADELMEQPVKEVCSRGECDYKEIDRREMNCGMLTTEVHMRCIKCGRDCYAMGW